MVQGTSEQAIFGKIAADINKYKIDCYIRRYHLISCNC